MKSSLLYQVQPTQASCQIVITFNSDYEVLQKNMHFQRKQELVFEGVNQIIDIQWFMALQRVHKLIYDIYVLLKYHGFRR